MKEVTRYEANDGAEFKDVEKCLLHDALILECEAEEVGLKPFPRGNGNGEGYVQQPIGSRDKLLRFLKFKDANRDSDGPVGRLLHRMHRIDFVDREWGQVYFAINPHKGKMVDLGALFPQQPR